MVAEIQVVRGGDLSSVVLGGCRGRRRAQKYSQNPQNWVTDCAGDGEGAGAEEGPALWAWRQSTGEPGGKAEGVGQW